MTTIGVLALQGAFIEHAAALRALGADVREVRLPRDLDGLDGLVIPGGESTTMGKLLVEYELLSPLRERVARGWPVFGTCAGAILLANDIGGLDQPLIGGLDAQVERNSFGRQIDSFETDLPAPALGAEPVHAIFIRAPRIRAVGSGVQILATLPDGSCAMVRQGRILATTFHPELTADRRVHQYFLSLVSGSG